MKKITLVLLAGIMLCGCGKTENETSVFSQESSEVSYIADYETSSDYTSVSSFQASSFAENLKEMGANIYLLEYDNSRYEFNSITADGSFYKYVLYDNEKEQSVRVSITYDKTMKNIGDVEATFYNDQSFSTKAQKDGTEYDVYMLATPYVDYENFGLLYVPYENCRVSIYAGEKTSAEEILGYFDDFQLVPESEA